MKKSKFLLAFMLVALFVGFSACSNDDDDVKNLVLEKNTVEVEKDSTITVKIKDGNGGYFIPTTKAAAKEEIAKATIEGNVVTIKGITAGNTTFTVKDKEGKTSTIAVSVFSIVGEWKNAKESLEVKAKDEAAEKAIKAEFKGSGFKNLTLKSDATFTMTINSETKNGTYTYKNRVLTLTYVNEGKSTSYPYSIAEFTKAAIKLEVNKTESYKEKYKNSAVTKAIEAVAFTR